jgi:hypothetical protein
MLGSTAEHRKDSRDRAPRELASDRPPDSPLNSILGKLDDGAGGGGAAEDAERLGMAAGCFRAAKSFIRGSMDRDEQLEYLLHVQQCPDCRGYLDAALMILRGRMVVETEPESMNQRGRGGS